MTQADRVHSTPPTNAPTSRRRFLSTAATLAAGGAALALAVVPASAISLQDDPVFAALDLFKKARSTLREAETAHSLLAERVFPHIFSMTPRIYCASYGCAENAYLAGTTFWPVMRSHADIDKFSPADLYPQDNKLEHAELDAARARRYGLLIPSQESMDAAWDAERAALQELVKTVPTTMPGVMALEKFYREYGEDPPRASAGQS
jgi:hypothetical protein